MTEPGTGRRVFRPRLWSTLLIIPMLAVLIALGTWQVNRHGETSAALALYHSQHDLAPTVTSLAQRDETDDNRLHRLHFRRATLSGTLEPKHAQLLTARYVLGRLGYGVTMPLRLTETNDGGAGPHAKLLVHLGRVPADKLPDYLATVRADTSRTLSGRLQVATMNRPEGKPVGEKAGLPTWRTSNPAALAKTIEGLEPRLMLVVGEQAVGKVVDAERIPVDGYIHPVRLTPAKHVEYAATWYGLGVTLIAIWLAFSFRRREDEVVVEG